MTPYSEVEEFSKYYLEDSFVLGIVATPGQIDIALDIVLTPEHPQYSADHPGDQHCYRRAHLLFRGVTSLVCEGQGLPPAMDAAGDVDYGGIDSWLLDDGGRHAISGSFGRIAVTASSAAIMLDAG